MHGHFRFIVILFALSASFWLGQHHASAIQTESVPEESIAPGDLEKRLETQSFDAKDVAATSAWIESVQLADWLGPLAPVAMSPFFGIACLSGLAIWGPEWITDNAILGSSGPLQSPVLFAIFVGLTVLTSAPRFTKVSKPFAQAVDRLETYSVILILLVVKIVSSMESDDTVPQVAMVQLGIVSVSADVLLWIAMAINVLVINSVKFFFEFLVWLTPLPFLDACFEVLNKTLCAGLMAIYAFSPTLATAFNLVLLVIAAIVLRWISRRVRFYRTMVLDPILARLWSGFGSPKQPELIVFPKDPLGPFPAKSRLKLIPSEEGGWEFVDTAWWKMRQVHRLENGTRPTIRRGWVMHSVEWTDASGESMILSFSRRYDAALDRLARDLKLELENDVTPETDAREHRHVTSEFA